MALAILSTNRFLLIKLLIKMAEIMSRPLISFLAMYLSIILSIIIYELISFGISISSIQQIISSEKFLYIAVTPLPPSLVIFFIVRSLEKSVSRSVSELSSTMRNYLDAYAVIMKRYDNEISSLRESLSNIESKNKDLDKRLLALEKLLPVLIDLSRRSE